MLALSTALLLAATGLGPTPSQPSDPGSERDTDEQARVGATNKYIYIDGESLEGEILRAEGAPVRGRLGLKHKSLIKLRGEFTDVLNRLSRDI